MYILVHPTTTNLYIPVFVISYGFLFVGNRFDGYLKPLFAFTSDISFYILLIGNTSKNQLKNSKSSPKFLRNSIQKILASMQVVTGIVLCVQYSIRNLQFYR